MGAHRPRPGVARVRGAVPHDHRLDQPVGSVGREEDLAGVLQTERASGAWTRDVPLYGGTLSKPELLAVAERGPASIAAATRRRLALTYGDKIETLFERIATDSGSAEEIAPGVTRAELDHAREIEDAMTAEDFLLRRTKLYLTLDPSGRDAVQRWFSG